MTAAELDRLMVLTYGADYREKVLVGPVGSFALRDCFAECGLRDPKERPRAESHGLWQMLPPTLR